MYVLLKISLLDRGILQEYRRVLQGQGYKSEVIEPHSGLDSCKITSTYVGTWRWDLALYLAYAEIKVFEDTKLVGNAVYDSRNGSASLGKFIDAETKIEELVRQLFPIMHSNNQLIKESSLNDM